MKSVTKFLTEAESILLEGRLDFLKQHFKGVSTDHDTNAEHRDSDAIVDHFATHADPTANKKHTQWIMNQYKKGSIRQEDHPRIKDALSALEDKEIKKNLPSTDINHYKSLGHLEDSISGGKEGVAEDKATEFNNAQNYGKVIHESPIGKTIHVTSMGTAIAAGKGTKWCTARDDDNNMFRSYSDHLHVHFMKDGNKFQSHAASLQFMDKNDDPITKSDAEKYRDHLTGYYDKTKNHVLASKFHEGTLDTLKKAAKDPEVTEGTIDNIMDYVEQNHGGKIPQHEQMNVIKSSSDQDKTHLITNRLLNNDPHPDVVDHAVNHHSENPAIRRTLLNHVKLTNDQAEKVTGNNQASIASFLFSNPDPEATAHIANKHFNSADQTIRESAISRTNKPEHIQDTLKNGNFLDLYHLSRNIHATPNVLRDIHTKAKASVLSNHVARLTTWNVVKHPDVPQDILTNHIKELRKKVENGSSLTENEKTQPEMLLAHLHRGKLTAENQEDLFHAAHNMGEQYVARSILRNSSMPIEKLQHYRDFNGGQYHASVKLNKKFIDHETDELLRQLKESVESEEHQYQMSLDDFENIDTLKEADNTGLAPSSQTWRAVRDGAKEYFNAPPEEQKKIRKQAEVMRSGKIYTKESGNTKLSSKNTIATRAGGNAKFEKTDEKIKSYRVMGISLAPSTMSGVDVCPAASKECRASCLGVSAGRSDLDSVKNSRIQKTDILFKNPKHFFALVDGAIQTEKKVAAKQGRQLAVRPNMFSDINWEHLAPEMFHKHHDVQFFDYTKVHGRAFGKKIPQNYHLTVSSTGVDHPESNWNAVRRHLDNGGVAAMTFKAGKDQSLPSHVVDHSTGKKYKVIDADGHDLRFLDKSIYKVKPTEGLVAGLRFKAKKKDTINKAQNFAVDVGPDNQAHVRNAPTPLHKLKV